MLHGKDQAQKNVVHSKLLQKNAKDCKGLQKIAKDFKRFQKTKNEGTAIQYCRNRTQQTTKSNTYQEGCTCAALKTNEI